jgi:hypothetical protein
MNRNGVPGLQLVNARPREPQRRGRRRGATAARVHELRPALHHLRAPRAGPASGDALLRAAHKRDVTRGDVDTIVARVETAIAETGGELSASRVGELCLDGLRELDWGAYLQFAGTLPTATPEFAATERGGGG